MLAMLPVAMLAAPPGGGSQARRSLPGLNRACIYQIWLRSFTLEGTLNAASLRLPHIARLGATIVYLSPIQLQSRQGGFSNPYRILDYARIDPEYGTEQDFRAFVETAHQWKLKVLMDNVFYHTAPDNVLLTQHADFYMHDGQKVAMGRWGLPRLDFGNRALRDYLIGNLAHWLADGADGFRCDVAFGIPLDFWEQARRKLETINPKLIMLAESDRPEDLQNAFDISYNFPYLTALQDVFHGGMPASTIRKQWEESHRRFPAGGLLLRASDNHDQQRAVSLFSQAGASAASVLNFTMDGVPFLYNGQEIGDTTAIDHRLHFPMRWELDKPQLPADSGVARAQAAINGWYERLVALRAREPDLEDGELHWVENSSPDSVISYERGHGRGRVLVLVNASNRKITGTVGTRGTAAMMLNTEGDRFSDGKFQLGAFGYVVAKLTDGR